MPSYCTHLWLLLGGVLLAALTTTSWAAEKRNYRIVIERCNSTQPAASVVSHFLCTTQYDKRYSYMSGEVELTVDVTAFTMLATFDMLRKDGSKINLLKMDIDGCAYFSGGYSDKSFMRLPLLELQRTANLPDRCHFKRHERYAIRNYTVRATDYPLILPLMSFIVRIKFYLAKAEQFAFTLHGRVESV